MKLNVWNAETRKLLGIADFTEKERLDLTSEKAIIAAQALSSEDIKRFSISENTFVSIKEAANYERN
jgi:hypothetical protein